MSRPEAQAGVAVDARDARLLERLHGDLPLTDRPFAEVGAEIRQWIIDTPFPADLEAAIRRLGPHKFAQQWMSELASSGKRISIR